MELIYKKGDEVTVGYPYAEGGFCQVDGIWDGEIIDINFNNKEPYLIELKGRSIYSYAPQNIICLSKDFTTLKLKEFIVKNYEAHIKEENEIILSYQKDLNFIKNGYTIFLDNAEHICQKLFEQRNVYTRSNSVPYTNFNNFKPYTSLNK